MCKSLQSLLRFLCCCAEAEHMQNVSAWTYFLRNDRCVAQSKVVHRESTHTHTPYLESTHTHTHHIFYRRGDNAQNVPRRTYTPQSLIANTACKVRAPHLLQSLLRFLCSCAEARHMQRSGHGLTSCAAIDDSRRVEYVHRQYSLQNTLHRNLQPLQRALTSANERSLPPASSGT